MYVYVYVLAWYQTQRNVLGGISYVQIDIMEEMTIHESKRNVCVCLCVCAGVLEVMKERGEEIFELCDRARARAELTVSCYSHGAVTDNGNDMTVVRVFVYM